MQYNFDPLLVMMLVRECKIWLKLKMTATILVNSPDCKDYLNASLEWCFGWWIGWLDAHLGFLGKHHLTFSKVILSWELIRVVWVLATCIKLYIDRNFCLNIVYWGFVSIRSFAITLCNPLFSRIWIEFSLHSWTLTPLD